MALPCCETCYYYDYDAGMDGYICLQEIDQDELSDIFRDYRRRGCPYYRAGDDYTLSRKQL